MSGFERMLGPPSVYSELQRDPVLNLSPCKVKTQEPHQEDCSTIISIGQNLPSNLADWQTKLLSTMVAEDSV